MPPAPVARVPAEGRSTAAAPRSAIEALHFTGRKESWVAEADGYFYKIVRRSNDPVRDLDDPACIDTARRECADMRFLHSLAREACAPERIEGACIVYRRLAGPDMRTLLLGRGPPEARAACLDGAMRLLARLHRGDASAYPVKDYRRDGFLPPDPEMLARMQPRPRTLVVTGFEARNFRFDAACNAWCFFDPHHLWRGLPEEDLARFVVSLLMLPGRRRGPRAWTAFDRSRLLSAYEALAPARLDRVMLNWFLAEELAKRQFYAMRLARQAPLAIRPAAVAYTALCYARFRTSLAAQHFQANDRVSGQHR